MENNNKNHVTEPQKKGLESSLDKNALLAQKKQELKAIEVQTPSKDELVEQKPLPTAQYITWGMLFLGWCIALFLYKRNKQNTQIQRTLDRHNTYVKEFKDLLFNIESSAIKFWTSAEDSNDQVKILTFQRKIKELTTKSQEISNSGGVDYPTVLLKKLRKYVTLDNDKRPLQASASRIDELREIVSELAHLYERKTD
jgi:hypothetical protein